MNAWLSKMSETYVLIEKKRIDMPMSNIDEKPRIEHCFVYEFAPKAAASREEARLGRGATLR